jgi:hypothetical protein
MGCCTVGIIGSSSAVTIDDWSLKIFALFPPSRNVILSGWTLFSELLVDEFGMMREGTFCGVIGGVCGTRKKKLSSYLNQPNLQTYRQIFMSGPVRKKLIQIIVFVIRCTIISGFIRRTLCLNTESVEQQKYFHQILAKDEKLP